MNKRLDFQKKLENLLGSQYVYYQPPESLKMEYPCIRYSKYKINSIQADNINYNNRDCYQVTVIDKKSDNPVIRELLQLPLSSYDRHYVSDNLNHDVILIYY